MMTPDEQEAQSIKYGNRGVWMVPLSSGNWAICDRSFQLVEIVPSSYIEPSYLGVLAFVFEERLRKVAPKKLSSNLSAEEMGL